MPLLLARRALLAAVVAPAAAADPSPATRPSIATAAATDPSPATRASVATAADSPLVARLLEATDRNRAANDAARRASYDRRNFEDYMGFEIGTSGAMRGVKPETRAAIEAWLAKNGKQ